MVQFWYSGGDITIYNNLLILESRSNSTKYNTNQVKKCKIKCVVDGNLVQGDSTDCMWPWTVLSVATASAPRQAEQLNFIALKMMLFMHLSTSFKLPLRILITYCLPGTSQVEL